MASQWISAGLLLVFLACQGSALRCYVCDSRSASSYKDANEQCNMGKMRECADPKASACMLEGYMKPNNKAQVVKRCVLKCPVFINTTAEVVRCCPKDGCNEALDHRTPPFRQPPQYGSPMDRDMEEGADRMGGPGHEGPMDPMNPMNAMGPMGPVEPMEPMNGEAAPPMMPKDPKMRPMPSKEEEPMMKDMPAKEDRKKEKKEMKKKKVEVAAKSGSTDGLSATSSSGAETLLASAVSVLGVLVISRL